MQSNKQILVVGDIHGLWDRLFHKLDRLGISNAILIGVGDLGVGFISPDKQARQIDLLNNRFKKNNIEFVAIRGNHDDPIYYDGSVKLSNFELIPDYTYRVFNGEEFLFVGGAVSIDRRLRTPGASWWPDEEFVLKEELLRLCDVIITHSAPSWLGPFDKKGIQSWVDRDPALWDDCRKERAAIDKMFNIVKPKKSYHGHFHRTETNFVNGCRAKILDELEIQPHR